MENSLSKDFWKEFSRIDWSWRRGNRLPVMLGVSRVCVKVGIVPKVCPVCLNPTEFFRFHHWGFKELEAAFRRGSYRRICASCNQLLGFGPQNPNRGDGRILRWRFGQDWREKESERLELVKLWSWEALGQRMYTLEMTWKGQYSLLSRYFRLYEEKYPNFDGVEREWSRFLPIEEELYRRVLGVWKGTSK